MRVVGTLSWRRLRAWILLGGLRIAGIGGGFLIYLVLVRLGGPEAFGRYTYWLYWALALAPIASGGCHHAAIRFISRYRARGRAGEQRAVTRWALRRSAVVGLAIALLGGIALIALTGLPPRYAPLWCALVLALMGLELASGIWQGRGRVHVALAADMVVRPLTVGVVAAGALLFTTGSGTWSAPALLGLDAGLSLLLVGCCLLAVGWGHLAGPPAGLAQRRLWHRAAGGYLAYVALVGISKNGDVLVAGAFLEPAEIGAFATAVRVSMLASLPLSVVNAMITHRISALKATGDREELARLLSRTSAAALAGSLAITAVMLPLAPWLLSLFHADFRIAAPALLVLLVSPVFRVGTGSVMWYLTMTGRQGRALWIHVQSLVILVVCGAILIPWLGLTGAAITSVAEAAAKNLVAWASIRRVDGIDTSPLGLLRRRRT